MYMVAMTQATRSANTSSQYHEWFKFSCSGGNSSRIVDMGVTKDTTGNEDKSGWTSTWFIVPYTDQGAVTISATGGRWIKLIGLK